MPKELFVSSSPHETKVAVLEDDQLVEVYYERDTDVGLVGGIYKGRVSRVLPGMQSAFVDIGLERDAFLYVTDFFLEDQDDYDKVLEGVEARIQRGVVETPTPEPSPEATAVTEVGWEKAPAEGSAPSTPPGAIPSAPGEPSATRAPQSPAEPSGAPAFSGPPHAERPPAEAPEYRRHEFRGRHNKRRGRGYREGRFSSRPDYRERQDHATPQSFEVLPGESLAKYSHSAPVAPAPEGPAASGEVPIQGLTGRPVSTPPESEIPVSAQSEGILPSAAGEPFEAITAEAGPAGLLPELVEAPLAEGPDETSAGQAAHDAPDAPVESLPAIETAPARESISTSLESGQIAPRFQRSVEHGVQRSEAPFASDSPALANQEQMPTFHPLQALDYAPPRSEPSTPSPQEPSRVSLPAETSEWAVPSATSGVTGEPIHASPTEDEQAQDSGPVFGAEPEGVPQGEAGSEPDISAEAASQPPSPAEAPSEAAIATSAGAPQTAPEPPKPSYTLREPHQRPRFAPRRGRRGRRGLGRRATGVEGRQEPVRVGSSQQFQISEMLKEGQEILVQIAKEPLGSKGARITSHIALPGRYLVYMPTIDHIGVSRKINSEEERLRLRNIILENKGSLTGGFIVRTAGEGRSEEEFRADLRFLSTLWNEIRARAERTKAPALIHHDLGLVERVSRDILSPDFKSIRVDNEVEYERILEFVNRCQPSLVGAVKLYTRPTPLFEEFGIQTEIEKALKPKVWLKSGGYIVINQTEALVSIDVNTGKFVGKTNRLEDTILKTNIEAVNEIVRQLRLRDLGGIIVIDFIDMDERKNRHKVVQAMEEALRHDRAPTKILSFNDFGLVAITRRRVKHSLERTLCAPCHYCSGSGWIKSLATVCYEIIEEARKMASQVEGDVLTLRVSPEVAKALKSREGVLISELESLTRKDVVIKADPTVHQERFEIF